MARVRVRVGVGVRIRVRYRVSGNVLGSSSVLFFFSHNTGKHTWAKSFSPISMLYPTFLFLIQNCGNGGSIQATMSLAEATRDHVLSSRCV